MADYFSPSQIEEFKKAFKLLDKNGDGDISCKELKKSLHALGQNPTNAEVKKIIKAVDTDGDGKMDFDEFLLLMKDKFITSDPKEELKRAFKVFDRNNDGYITPKELYKVLTMMGEKMTMEEANEMIKEADVTGNGKIDYEEFVNTLVEKL